MLECNRAARADSALRFGCRRRIVLASSQIERGLEMMTTEERLEKLEQELSRVKRRNRWLAIVVGLSIVGMGLAWVLETAAPGVIRANVLVIEDADGNTRFSVHAEEDGAKLDLYDGSGRRRAELGARSDGGGLALFDENDKCRAGLSVVSSIGGIPGMPMLVLADENQNNRVMLTAVGTPALTMLDEGGNSVVMLRAGDPGPMLALGDGDGNLRAGLGVGKDGAELSLCDKQGKTIWQAPPTGDSPLQTHWIPAFEDAQDRFIDTDDPEHRSQRHGFTVRFPQKPQVKVISAGTTYETTAYESLVEGQGVYKVIVNTLPLPELSDKAMKFFLDTYLSGKLAVYGGKPRF